MSTKKENNVVKNKSLRKSMTNDHYYRILYILAKSDRPLSSYEIKKRIKERWVNMDNQDFYRKIQELSPYSYYQFDKRTLIILDKLFQVDDKEIVRFLSIMETIFDFKWNIRLKDLTKIEFGKNGYILSQRVKMEIDRKECKISFTVDKSNNGNEDRSTECVKLYFYETRGDNGFIVTYYKDGEEVGNRRVLQSPEYSKRNHFYVEKYRNPTKFLDVVLDVEAKSKSDVIRDNWEKIRDIDVGDISRVLFENQIPLLFEGDNHREILSNSRYYRYKINLRGLLFFLYLDSTKEKGRKAKEVLSNKTLLGVAPFLMYWEDFYNDEIPVIEQLYDISNGLVHELNYLDPEDKRSNDNTLLYESTRKLFSFIETKYRFRENIKYNHLPSHYLVDNKWDKDEYSDLKIKLLRYRLYMTSILKDIIKKYQDSVVYLHDFYVKEYNKKFPNEPHYINFVVNC